MSSSPKMKGYLNALISAFSFGLIPLFVIPFKTKNIDMDAVLMYRFFFAVIMICPFIIYKGQDFRVSKYDFGKFILMGIFYALSAEFLFWGYDLLSAGIASTILYTYPMVVALILTFVFKEKINFSTMLSILFASCGVMIMSWQEAGGTFNYFGMFIVFLSALSYALYMVFVNKGNIKTSFLVTTFYSIFFSGVFYFVKLQVLGKSVIISDFETLGYLALFSFITTVISVVCIVYAIGIIGSATASVLGALEPVIAVLISVILFSEKVTWTLVTGVILVLCALVLSVIGDMRKKGPTLSV